MTFARTSGLSDNFVGVGKQTGRGTNGRWVEQLPGKQGIRVMLLAHLVIEEKCLYGQNCNLLRAIGRCFWT